MESANDDDEGYVSPVFDLPPLGSDEEADEFPRPTKRQKKADWTSLRPDQSRSLAADEELALRLLSGGP